MSSLTVERRGSQKPRLLLVPPGRVSGLGEEVVDLAALHGLFLDPWQIWVLDNALALAAGGEWLAAEVLLIVCRQNGKGSVLEALELAGLFLFGYRLIIHSAQLYSTAVSHYRRLKSLIADGPFMDLVDSFPGTHGAQGVVLKSGARLEISARSRNAARGMTADLIVFDEAYKLDADAMGAMIPTTLTKPDMQIWYTSSAPHADSTVLHEKRAAAIAGEAPGLFYAEWGNEPGVDLDDWAARAAANPSLGYRITPESLDKTINILRGLGNEAAREALGVPDLPDGGANVFGAGRWQACVDVDSVIVGEPSAALAVGTDMAWASFAVAGRRADGLMHISLARRDPGIGWVVDEARRVTQAGVALTVDPRSPAAGLLADLRDAGVPFVEVAAAGFTKACAHLQAAVIDGKVRHLQQGPLDAAVNGAAVRTAGESWVWAAGRSTVDISPLVACTLALWAAADRASVELVVL